MGGSLAYAGANRIPFLEAQDPLPFLEHDPARESTADGSLCDIQPHLRLSTIIFALLVTLFFIGVCRDGLSEPEEEPPQPVLQDQDPFQNPGFNTEDLSDWQRRPGRLPLNSKLPDAADYSSESAFDRDQDVRIAIASMPWGESVHPVYEEAIQVMENYAHRHGYETRILTQGITSNCVGLPVDCNSVDRKNLGGAWNKMLHLVNIITTELMKPEDERLEWIMYVFVPTMTSSIINSGLLLLVL